MRRPLTAMLTHHAAERVDEIAAWWCDVTGERLVVVHGGLEKECAKIRRCPAVHVPDPGLRTRDHQRQRQSYSGVLRAIAGFAGAGTASSVQILEFDCLPLIRGFPEELQDLLHAQDAGLLGSGLRRIDQTGHPHWLYHVSDPGFEKMLEGFSVREDKHVVLSMLGCVSVWRPDVLMAVAALEEKVPTYLELWLPTAAHHLGYRVRGLGEHDKWISHEGEFTPKLLEIQAAGGWMAHPAKQFWEEKNRGLRETVLQRAGGIRQTQSGGAESHAAD